MGVVGRMTGVIGACGEGGRAGMVRMLRRIEVGSVGRVCVRRGHGCGKSMGVGMTIRSVAGRG